MKKTVRILLYALCFIRIPFVFAEDQLPPQQFLTQITEQLSPDPATWNVVSQAAIQKYPGLQAAAMWFPHIVVDDTSRTEAIIQLAQKPRVEQIHYYGTPEEIKANQKKALLFLRVNQPQFIGHPLKQRSFPDVIQNLVNSVSKNSKFSPTDWRHIAEALETQPQLPASVQMPTPVITEFQTLPNEIQQLQLSAEDQSTNETEDNLRNQLRAKEAALEKLSGQLEKARQDLFGLELLRSRDAEFSPILKTQQETQDRMEKRIVTIEHQAGELTHSLETTQQELERGNRNLETVFAQREAHLRLERDLVNTKKQIEFLEAERTQLQKATTELEQKAARSERVRSQMEEKTNSLMKALNEKEAALESTRQQLENQKTQLQKLKLENEKTRGQVIDVRRQLQEEEKGKISRLTQELQTAAHNFKAYRQEVEIVQGGLKQSEKKLAQVWKEREQLDTELQKEQRTAQEQKKYFEEEFAQAHKTESELAKQLQEKDSLLKENQEHSSKQEKQFKQLTSSEESLSRQIVELKNQLKEKESALRAKEKEISVLKEKLDKLNASASSGKQRQEATEQKISQLNQDLKNAREGTPTQQKEKNQIKQQIEALQQQLNQNRSQAQKLHENMDNRFRAAAEEFSQLSRTSQATIEQLQQRLRLTQQQFNEARVQWKESKKNAEELQASLKQNRQELARLEEMRQGDLAKQLEATHNNIQQLEAALQKEQEEKQKTQTDLEGKMNSLKEQTVQLSRQMAQLIQEKTTLTDELALLKQANEKLKQVPPAAPAPVPAPAIISSPAPPAPTVKHPSDIQKDYTAFQKMSSSPSKTELSPAKKVPSEKIDSTYPLVPPRSFIEVSKVREDIGFLLLSVKEAPWATSGSTVLLSSQGQPVAEVQVVDVDQSGMATAYLSRKIDPNYTIQLGDLFRAQPFIRTSDASTSDDQQ